MKTPRERAIEHGGPFSLILADCPWQYSQNDQRCRGGALNHYATMPDDDIAALPVEDFADKDAILVMWCCWPQFASGVDIARAWGFDQQVTGIPWVKQLPDGRVQVGVGHWFMATSEFVLVFRRGNAPLPKVPGGAPAGLLVGQDLQFYATRRKHSAKPLGMIDWLSCLPGPRLELFARNETPGWVAWGGDLGWWITPEGVQKDESPRLVQRDLF